MPRCFAAGTVRFSGAVTSAQQSGADPIDSCAFSGSAAGCMFRHRFSSWPQRASPTISRSRSASTRKACDGMGFTDCHMNISRNACRRWRRTLPVDASSSRIWAAVPRCAPWRVDAVSKAPWVSQRSTGCRWARGPASSIPEHVLFLINQMGMSSAERATIVLSGVRT